MIGTGPSDKFKRIDLKNMLANTPLRRNVTKELVINETSFDILYDSRTDVLTIIDSKENKISLAKDNHYFYIKDGLLVVGNALRVMKIDRKAFYCIKTYIAEDDNRETLKDDDFYMSIWKWLYPNLFLANTNSLEVFLLEKRKYNLGETVRIVDGDAVTFETFTPKELDDVNVKNFILKMGLNKYRNSININVNHPVEIFTRLDEYLTKINDDNKDL